MAKELGAIDYIDFNPIQPHYFAVTCSVRIQVYNPITKLVVKNLSRFDGMAYGGTYRKDGRLLVSGEESGVVKLFDTASKSVLRSFRGHTAATHRVSFTADNTHLISFSDDKSVKLWDIPGEKVVQTYSNHDDYIRAGCTSPVSPNIFVSGGYDKMIKVYDSRIGGSSEKNVIFEVNHGSPIESLLFLPAGGILLSAGGTEIKVWDAFASGKLMAQISQHHKTVTCLRMASHGRRFMSAGLDRHVKVYDIVTYKPVHSFDFPNSVLSLGIAPNDETLVAGMVDGLISIQRMDEDSNTANAAKTPKRRKKITTNVSAICIDEVVPDYQRKTEAKYDKFLRKYQYTDALDAVLLPYVVNKTPHVTVSVMQELIRRKGLVRALSGRTNTSLSAILRFITRYLSDHRFTRVLIDVTNTLLCIYETTFDKFVGNLGRDFLNLARMIHREENLTKNFLQLQGAIELVTAGATVGEAHSENAVVTEKSTPEPSSEMMPTETALENMVISVN